MHRRLRRKSDRVIWGISEVVLTVASPTILLTGLALLVIERAEVRCLAFFSRILPDPDHYLWSGDEKDE
jgi:hypothetical protein